MHFEACRQIFCFYVKFRPHGTAQTIVILKGMFKKNAVIVLTVNPLDISTCLKPLKCRGGRILKMSVFFFF